MIALLLPKYRPILESARDRAPSQKWIHGLGDNSSASFLITNSSCTRILCVSYRPTWNWIQSHCTCTSIPSPVHGAHLIHTSFIKPIMKALTAQPHFHSTPHPLGAVHCWSTSKSRLIQELFMWTDLSSQAHWVHMNWVVGLEVISN